MRNKEKNLDIFYDQIERQLIFFLLITLFYISLICSIINLANLIALSHRKKDEDFTRKKDEYKWFTGEWGHTGHKMKPIDLSINETTKILYTYAHTHKVLDTREKKEEIFN